MRQYKIFFYVTDYDTHTLSIRSYSFAQTALPLIMALFLSKDKHGINEHFEGDVVTNYFNIQLINGFQIYSINDDNSLKEYSHNSSYKTKSKFRRDIERYTSYYKFTKHDEYDYARDLVLTSSNYKDYMENIDRKEEANVKANIKHMKYHKKYK